MHRCKYLMFVVAWVGNKSISNHKCMHFMKCMLHSICPWHQSFLFQTRMIGQWFEYVSTTGSHITIKIGASNEHVKFSGIVRAIHVSDCLYFLLPLLKALKSKPITKPFNFIDGPFTFQWMCGISILMQATQDIGQELNRVVPIFGE